MARKKSPSRPVPRSASPPQAAKPAALPGPGSVKESQRLWGERLQRLTRLSEDARMGLIEEVARQRAFGHLHEEYGPRSDNFPALLDSAAEDCLDGTFFLRNFSLFNEVSPELSLAVFHLRQEWITQYGLNTVPELLLLDQAMLAYFQVLRLNREVAATLALTEQSLYYPDGPDVRIKRRHGLGPEFDGLQITGHIKALQKRLVPLIERFNAMFLRSLRALRELKAAPISISIGQVGQVNVGGQQVNVVE